MALAVVTCTKLRVGSGTSVSGAIATPAAGNLLATGLAVFGGTSSNFAVSDDQNGSHSRADHRDGTAPACSGHYFAGAANAATTLTGNFGTGGQGGTAFVYEFSGEDTSVPFNTGENTGATGTTTAPATGQATNAQADAVFFAVIAVDTSANPATLTINNAGTDGTWLEHANARETNGSSFMVGSMVYQIVASSAARQHAWGTANVNSARSVWVINAAGGAPPPVAALLRQRTVRGAG